jgi:hypothetical protein
LIPGLGKRAHPYGVRKSYCLMGRKTTTTDIEERERGRERDRGRERERVGQTVNAALFRRRNFPEKTSATIMDSFLVARTNANVLLTANLLGAF